VEHTPLADLYLAQKYQPLTVAAAVARSAYLKVLFDRNRIPIIRLGLQATEELDSEGVILAGPYHPAFGEMVESYLFYLMVSHFCETAVNARQEVLVIKHHPRDHSKVRGQGAVNLKRWRDNYGVSVRLVAGWPNQGELGIYFQDSVHIINKTMLSKI
jgi:histone acetyltransferase (RNA polymerase elongator complex component)